MATRSATCVLHHLRCAALLPREPPLSDGQLLDRYITTRDDRPFAALVQRHGPMVLGVCRRILHNDADAEDAFQATFLVFVLKAASIRSTALLGNWLYGVAYNTARKAKAMNRTRRAREIDARCVAQVQPEDLDAREVQEVLDAELAALPETYRAAVVLCDLEGKTIKDAAAQLGWPQGTVASRVRRGRAQLAKRLAERGLTFSAGMLPAAAVPATLLSSTVQAASLVAAGQTVTSGLVSAHIAALVQGVLQAMFVSKLKTMSVVFLVAILGLSGSLFSPLAGGRTAQPALAAAQTKADDSLKATLLALDRHLWEAFARGDWQERQKFLANDLISISPLGKHGKADAAEADKRHRCSEWSIRDDDCQGRQGQRHRESA